MKKYYAFLAIFIAVFAFSSVMKAQTWDEPRPVGTSPEAGSGYYVYNVGAKAFLDRGGEWGSQAVLSPSKGSLLTIVASGDLWIFQYESNIRTLFRANVADGWTYTDNSIDNTWKVVLQDADNLFYSIQSPENFASYNADQFLGGSSVIYNSNSGLVYDVRYNRPAGDYTKWVFCTEASVNKYNAQVKLSKYMKIASLTGSSVDLTAYINTYNTGTTAEIVTATENLMTALAPEDKSSMIVNATFNETPTVGWTATANFGYNFQTIEYFGRSFDVYQVINGLPAGVYTLKAQGYERPAALNAAAQNWYTQGWDSRSSRLYATVGQETVRTPIKSIFGETTSPAGSLVEGITYPNSMSNANDAFQMGLYENELTYFVVDGTGTARIGAVGSFRNNGSYTMSQWVMLDNFRLYYYGALAIPNLTVSKTAVLLSNAQATSTSFEVIGANMQSAITITVPAGITLVGANLVDNGGGSYTIALANANTSNNISLIWDEAENMTGTISISSEGVDTNEISVKLSKDKDCFTPLSTTLQNLVPDPHLNTIPGAWGNVSLVSGSEAYCGLYSIKIDGSEMCWPNGGSISIPAVAWEPNSIYQMRAMVKTIDGSFNMGVQNANVNGGTGDYNIAVPHTDGEWVLFTGQFTTGDNPGTGVAFFNNCGASTGMKAYIDNWEIYNVTSVVTNNAKVSNTGIYVSKVGDQLRVFNTCAGEMVRVYSINGQLISAQEAQQNYLDLNLRNGLYIIKTADQVVKVVLN